MGTRPGTGNPFRARVGGSVTESRQRPPCKCISKRLTTDPASVESMTGQATALVSGLDTDRYGTSERLQRAPTGSVVRRLGRARSCSVSEPPTRVGGAETVADRKTNVWRRVNVMRILTDAWGQCEELPCRSDTRGRPVPLGSRDLPSIHPTARHAEMRARPDLLQPCEKFLQPRFIQHGPAKLVGFVELAARIGAGNDVVGLFGNARGNLRS